MENNITPTITKAYQSCDWDTPGWDYATNALISFVALSVPATFQEIIYITTNLLQAALASEKWLSLLNAIVLEL